MSNHFIFIFPLLFVHTFCALGQTGIDEAAHRITTADSVILISHVVTNENHDKPEAIPNDTTSISFPSFFSGDDINPAIIVQRQLLSKSNIAALAKIIRKPIPKSNIGYVPLCFEPHHSILIYNKGRLSYIDICFHCNGLVTSSDLNLNNTDFKNGKWKDMKVYFLRHGLTYEMEDKF